MSEPIIKKITVPLSVDQMKEAFLNKADRDAGKIKYVVDYANSTIKGDVLLQFLSNLEIQADFDFTGASKKDRFDFLATYFKMRSIIKNKDLNYAAAAVLLYSKDFSAKEVEGQSFLSEEEVKEFYVTHKPLVDKWSLMLDSCLLLILRVSSPETSLDEYEEVVDPSYCGVNFVNLFNVHGFFCMFTSKPEISELKWFTHQFEGFSFNNDFLFKIISESNVGVFPPTALMKASAENVMGGGFLETLDQDLERLIKEKEKFNADAG
jgi:hypothetical protein